MHDKAANRVHTVTRPETLASFLQMPGGQRLNWAKNHPGIEAPISWRFVRILAFSRPRTCVPGMLAFYFACIVSGDVSVKNLLIGMIVSYHIAAIANLFNLYTDIEEDNENIPSRVYELGLYGRKNLLRDTYILTAIIFGLSLFVNRYFAALTLLALIGCQQYSFHPFRMKARPRTGILFFANAVAYPYVSAALASAQKFSIFTDRRYDVLAIYLFVWFCAKGLIKNVPDYHGDKKANVTTSATLSSSRLSAGMIAGVATVVVYVAVALPVLLGFLDDEYFIALLWAPVACFQAGRLLVAPDEKASNDMLRDDMFVSAGYLSTLILIEQFSLLSVGVIVLGLTAMFLSDRLRLDTRRKEDFQSASELAGLPAVMSGEMK